jgi:biopolymer transport protein ExbB/TolQ
MTPDIESGNWFEQGGFVMYILTLFSIVVITITLEKIFYLARIGKKIDLLKNAVKSRSKDDFLNLKKDPISVLYERILQIKESSKTIDEALRSLRRGTERLEARMTLGIGWLATIGNTSPFVGLFGTVLGIIRAFHSLSAADPAAYGGVSRGIAEALVATASGLVVAVPSVMLYNYFVRRIANIMVLVRTEAEDFLEDIMH